MRKTFRPSGQQSRQPAAAAAPPAAPRSLTPKNFLTGTPADQQTAIKQAIQFSRDGLTTDELAQHFALPAEEIDKLLATAPGLTKTWRDLNNGTHYVKAWKIDHRDHRRW